MEEVVVSKRFFAQSKKIKTITSVAVVHKSNVKSVTSAVETDVNYNSETKCSTDLV